MKTNYILTVSVVFLIAGCSNTRYKNEEAELVNSANYSCENEKELTVLYFTTGAGIHRARIQLENAEYDLENVVSASGARYSDGSYTWWSKGNSGFFEIDGVVTLKNCVSLK